MLFFLARPEFIKFRSNYTTNKGSKNAKWKRFCIREQEKKPEFCNRFLTLFGMTMYGVLDCFAPLAMTAREDAMTAREDAMMAREDAMMAREDAMT